MAMVGKLQDFSDSLPGLRAARRAGRLVPFVGAGISRPRCRSWPGFIEELYRGFEITPDGPLDGQNPEALYRAADRVAAWLRLRPTKDRRERLRRALFEQGSAELPAQALALASVDWPLVVTTNYDDIMPLAFKGKKRDVAILGRSQTDCARVIRSLDVLEGPIVWYIQGHVAEDDARPALLDEVVVGHQQYQQVINSSAAFRRAFSEIFRRRSLLFIGSGLAESYFVNLIAEALFALGPSSLPHFALFCEADLKALDPEFLSVRLGITPILYGRTHAELPRALKALSGEAEHGGLRGMGATTFAIDRGNQATSGLEIHLRHGALQTPRKDGCVVLSVGRYRDDGLLKPALGEQAKSFLRKYIGPGQHAVTRFVAINGLPQGRMFRVHHQGEAKPAFLLVARDLSFDLRDRAARSLASITEATQEALGAIEREGFRHAEMGLMSAGPQRKDAAPYCLIAQLSGIRAFAAADAPPCCRLGSIGISIVDDDVWSPLMQGRIPVYDLLTSRMARVLVRVFDPMDTVEEFALSVPLDATVGEVLDTYRIGSGGTAVAHPLPHGELGAMRATRVFPGMIIDVHPAP